MLVARMSGIEKLLTSMRDQRYRSSPRTYGTRQPNLHGSVGFFRNDVVEMGEGRRGQRRCSSGEFPVRKP